MKKKLNNFFRYLEVKINILRYYLLQKILDAVEILIFCFGNIPYWTIKAWNKYYDILIPYFFDKIASLSSFLLKIINFNLHKNISLPFYFIKFFSNRLKCLFIYFLKLTSLKLRFFFFRNKTFNKNLKIFVYNYILYLIFKYFVFLNFFWRILNVQKFILSLIYTFKYLYNTIFLIKIYPFIKAFFFLSVKLIISLLQLITMFFFFLVEVIDDIHFPTDELRFTRTYLYRYHVKNIFYKDFWDKAYVNIKEYLIMKIKQREFNNKKELFVKTAYNFLQIKVKYVKKHIMKFSNFILPYIVFYLSKSKIFVVFNTQWKNLSSFNKINLKEFFYFFLQNKIIVSSLLLFITYFNIKLLAGIFLYFVKLIYNNFSFFFKKFFFSYSNENSLNYIYEFFIRDYIFLNYLQKIFFFNFKNKQWEKEFAKNDTYFIKFFIFVFGNYKYARVSKIKKNQFWFDKKFYKEWKKSYNKFYKHHHFYNLKNWIKKHSFFFKFNIRQFYFIKSNTSKITFLHEKFRRWWLKFFVDPNEFKWKKLVFSYKYYFKKTNFFFMAKVTLKFIIFIILKILILFFDVVASIFDYIIKINPQKIQKILEWIEYILSFFF